MSASYLTFEEAKQKLRDATRIVLDTEKDFKGAAERAADAEAVYRSELAKALKAHRAEGRAVAEAVTLAHAEVVVHSRERDYAASMLKLAGERLEDARDSRRSLWRLVTWSMEHDRGAAPENTPGAEWP